jgi:hypothetical protein
MPKHAPTTRRDAGIGGSTYNSRRLELFLRLRRVWWIVATLAAALAVGASPCRAASDPRVTVADVELVTGLRGVTLSSPPLAKADRLTFADRRGRPIVVVAFFSAAEYERAKTTIGQAAGGRLAEFHADVAGIGDEAFDAPASTPTFAVYARKGAAACLVMSMLNEPGTPTARQPRVSQTELRRLARIVVSRL